MIAAVPGAVSASAAVAIRTGSTSGTGRFSASSIRSAAGGGNSRSIFASSRTCSGSIARSRTRRFSARGPTRTSSLLFSASVQWAAVRTRSGAIRAPPQPLPITAKKGYSERLLAVDGSNLERLTAAGVAVGKSGGSGFGAGLAGLGLGARCRRRRQRLRGRYLRQPDRGLRSRRRLPLQLGQPRPVTWPLPFPLRPRHRPGRRCLCRRHRQQPGAEIQPRRGLPRHPGGAGRAPGRFLQPKSVATDSAGNVYVADAGEPYPDDGGARVQKFSSDGTFVTQWGDLPVPRPARPGSAPVPASGRKADRHLSLPPQRDGRHPAVPADRHGSGEEAASLARCTSPRRYSHLASGKKLFQLRALRDGVSGPVARRPWLILGP